MAIQSAPRAPYSSDPARSRGRIVPEPASPSRNDFRRDCDRIIHSAAFRRLKYKTQVFVFHEGDHYRTRLTHTLEVQQIARSLARVLGLDEDLAEALALAHDLGHPPFGHIGERALDEELKPFGGFDHNAQALQLVTALERRYADFDGLNLTWETLEGLVKHNGPLTDREGQPAGRYRERGVPRAILDFAQICDLQLWSYASAEAQVAAISDDIAYNAHDIDDGLRAGLFRIDDLDEVPFAGGIVREIRRRYPALEPARFAHEIVRRLITWMIEDVAAEATRRLNALAPSCADDIRNADHAVIAFSAAMAEAERGIKDFLFPRMYRHARVVRVMGEAEGVVRDLFRHFVKAPEDMPEEWQTGLAAAGEATRARRAGDFIAGMTDRF
ncbi:deoxyguanosinetriphosphate triphosphohydrolase, partial [Pseudorhodoplanes sp.]|uniref:deoxyguanosinetriphosphate triphosphohydrolase n=1 Tax=Pseudorhodoplanes sp. TaxID=1934341 RepID=UPI00391B0C82